MLLCPVQSLHLNISVSPISCLSLHLVLKVRTCPLCPQLLGALVSASVSLTVSVTLNCFPGVPGLCSVSVILFNSFIETYSQTVQFVHLKQTVSTAVSIFIDLCIHQHYQFQTISLAEEDTTSLSRSHILSSVSLPSAVSVFLGPSLPVSGIWLLASIPQVSGLSRFCGPHFSGSVSLCFRPWDLLASGSPHVSPHL